MTYLTHDASLANNGHAHRALQFRVQGLVRDLNGAIIRHLTDPSQHTPTRKPTHTGTQANMQNQHSHRCACGTTHTPRAAALDIQGVRVAGARNHRASDSRTPACTGTRTPPTLCQQPLMWAHHRGCLEPSLRCPVAPPSPDASPLGIAQTWFPCAKSWTQCRYAWPAVGAGHTLGQGNR